MVPSFQSFGFYINGGLDRLRFEQTYTETLKSMYHLLHIELNEDDRAFKLLIETMERQLGSRSNKNFCFDLNEWVLDCLDLAQHEQDKNHYRQAQYCLQAAYQLLPIGKKKKLRARINL